MTPIPFIHILAIVVSMVALTITVLGFFASLKFYRDGVQIQSLARDALARIEEKAASIHTQVGGMFDKTLEAAIGRTKLDQNFDAVSQQLETTTRKIMDSALSQIGTAGDDQRKQLSETVNREINVLRRRIEKPRESAEELAESAEHAPIATGSTGVSSILNVLCEADQPLADSEIAERARVTHGAAIVRLHNLVRSGWVDEVREDGKSPCYKISSRAHFPK